MADRPLHLGTNGTSIPGPGLRRSPPPAPSAAVKKPSSHDVVRIAAAAVVDPKTVRDYLRGRASRSTTRARIEAALVSCGLGELVRQSA